MWRVLRSASQLSCYFLSEPERAQRDKQCSVVGGIEVCEDDNSFELTRWAVENESANGCMLIADTETTNTEPPVGELIALADHDTHGAPRLRIGIVRWLRKPNSSSPHIGVEILVGTPQAARGTRTPASAMDVSTPVAFFPARSGQPPALLMPTALYAPAATVRVVIGVEHKLLDMDLPLSESPLYVLAAVFSAKC